MSGKQVLTFIDGVSKVLMPLILAWSIWVTKTILAIDARVDKNQQYVINRGEYRDYQYESLEKKIGEVKATNDCAHDKISGKLDKINDTLTNYMIDNKKMSRSNLNNSNDIR